MPLVSVYIPTYNRAAKITSTIESVLSQTFTDWELIIVDDGSTDNTRDVVSRLTEDIDQDVKYIYQENHGLFHSRNIGVRHASGMYVAPLDSDDVWEPHHLAKCIEVLQGDDSIDWVFAAMRRVDVGSKKVFEEHSFYRNGRPEPFLKLNCEQSGSGFIITDMRLLEFSIQYGLGCAQQTSLIRRDLLMRLPFRASHRNCEDQQLPIRAAAEGVRFAYINDVHLTYYAHDDNISNVSDSVKHAKSTFEGLEKRVRVQRALIGVLDELHSCLELDRNSTRILNHRLSKEYFWHLGYGILWPGGQYKDAMKAFRKGLQLRPFHIPYLKSYLACSIKLLGLKVTGEYKNRQ